MSSPKMLRYKGTVFRPVNILRVRNLNLAFAWIKQNPALTVLVTMSVVYLYTVYSGLPDPEGTSGSKITDIPGEAGDDALEGIKRDQMERRNKIRHRKREEKIKSDDEVGSLANEKGGTEDEEKDERTTE